MCILFFIYHLKIKFNQANAFRDKTLLDTALNLFRIYYVHA